MIAGDSADRIMLPILRRALRAAVIFLCHAFLACVLVFGAWVVDGFIHLQSGSGEILIYGNCRFPICFRRSISL